MATRSFHGSWNKISWTRLKGDLGGIQLSSRCNLGAGNLIRSFLKYGLRCFGFLGLLGDVRFSFAANTLSDKGCIDNLDLSHWNFNILRTAKTTNPLVGMAVAVASWRFWHFAVWIISIIDWREIKYNFCKPFPSPNSKLSWMRLSYSWDNYWPTPLLQLILQSVKSAV